MLGRGDRLRFAGWICGFACLAMPASAAAPRSRTQIEADIRKEADEDAAAGQRNVDVAVRVFTDEARQAGIEPREIVAIYQAEYRAEHDRRQPGPWGDQYKFKLMTAVAVVLGLIALLRDSVLEVLRKGLGRLWGAIYARYAGSRVLRRFAVKKYHRRLVDRLAVVRLPFRPDRPLTMREIYVPLRSADSGAEAAREHSRASEDAFVALTAHRRLVVLGAPGAGKSMLLKHVALACAEHRLPAALGQPIPVLIELHRLADPKATIAGEIVAEFGRMGFPHAESFVAHNLDRGSLLLLLDGLDELTPAQRNQAARHITDLIREHTQLRVVVTCRVAVYKGELDDIAEHKLELVDFNDQQIQRYLRTWAPSLPPGKSVEELLNALANRPQIKKLAGNPLLLTIIAYLYADHPDVVLPHSRAQFYKVATDQLLERWHHEQNQFTLPQKRAILEHLALFNQSGTDPDDPDRRTMDFRAVTREVQTLCPSLGIKPDDAGRVLQEIVERSGLLLAIDGGQRYCFAHLTLQEYFTAARLQHEPDAMLQHHEADRDGWRETLRLWCGLAPDSTDVIRKMSGSDAVMSFECLADAQKVAPDLAAAIIEKLKTMLNTRGPAGDRIQAAFGTVAADPRPRGVDVFGFLVTSLDEDALRPMAASALAQTNLVRAANALGDRARADTHDVRGALVAMGDLAVPVLVHHAIGDLETFEITADLQWRHIIEFVFDQTMNVQGNIKLIGWALNDLRAIGTPRVAEALVPLLWHRNYLIRSLVAVVLGEMLRDAHVETALRTLALALGHREARGPFDWVWRPFEPRDETALPVIVGRIVELLMEVFRLQARAGFDTYEGVKLDGRIMIPMCLAMLADEFDCATRLQGLRTEVLQRVDNPANDLDANDRARAFAAAMLTKAGASKGLRMTVTAMAPALQETFIRRLIVGQRMPTQADWVSMFRPTKYDLEEGWHLRVYLMICLSLCVPALLEIVQRAWHAPFELSFSYAIHGIGALVLAVIIVSGLSLAVFRWPRGDVGEWLMLSFVAPVLIPEMVRDLRHPSERSAAIGGGVILIGVGVIWAVVIWSYGRPFLMGHLVDEAVIAWLAGAVVCASLVIFRGLRMSRIAMNPLFGLWDDVPRDRIAMAPGRGTPASHSHSRSVLSLLRDTTAPTSDRRETSRRGGADGGLPWR